ncbi:MAG: hypothetical protein M3380_09240 [Chloroflexota bacterium]|nr:hypothetical protein [Chloroflexota bacterium]
MTVRPVDNSDGQARGHGSYTRRSSLFPGITSSTHRLSRLLVPWAGFAFALMILFHLAAAYRSSTVIDVGERPAATFLYYFWEPEQAPAQAGSFSYQWSTGRSMIDFPDLQTGDRWTLMLRGWIEPAANPNGIWLAMDEAVVHLPLRQGTRHHAVLSPRSGPVRLLRATQDTDPSKDIGFALDRARFTRITWHFLVHRQLLIAALEITLFLAFLVRAAELDRRDTLLTLAGSTALLSLTLAAYPEYALRAVPRLLVLLPAVLAAGLPCYLWFTRARHLVPGYVIAALALVVVLKSAGILYPNYYGVDTGYHVRGVQQVVQGSLYRIGGGAGAIFPYPPAVYVALAPFGLLFPRLDSTALQWLVLFGSILVDSSTILLLHRILSHPGVSERVRRWTALLYVCLPAGFILFWHATIAQNIGQWFLIAYLTALIPSLTAERPLTLARAGVLTVLSCLACLGHTGVFLNFNLMFVLLVTLFPGFALRYRSTIATWLAGTVASIVLYYTVFWPVIAEQARHLTGQSEEGATTRWHVFQDLVWGLGIRDHYLGIYAVLAVVALGAIAWCQRHRYFEVLVRVFGAMLLTTLLLGLLQVGILLNPTRYIIFSHTAVAIFAAFFLAFVQRYKGSWLATRLLIGATLVWSLALWASGFALHLRRAWLS